VVVVFLLVRVISKYSCRDVHCDDEMFELF